MALNTKPPFSTNYKSSKSHHFFPLKKEKFLNDMLVRAKIQRGYIFPKCFHCYKSYKPVTLCYFLLKHEGVKRAFCKILAFVGKRFSAFSCAPPSLCFALASFQAHPKYRKQKTPQRCLLCRVLVCGDTHITGMHIQSTPDNLKRCLLEPHAYSNQNQFALDFHHTITVILPSVTRTLDNSNFLLTRSNFHFPRGHFQYNFTLDNSNHVCQDVTGQNIP